MPSLISAAQLDKFRKNPKNITILDASWHLPDEHRDGYQEFLQNHVAGARFLDLNVFHDTASPVSNMLISDAAAINEKVAALGITNEHKIIFYDQSGLHTSCRAAWMFKVFGHDPAQLYILDGGLAAWEKYGGKVETGEARPISAKGYTATVAKHYLRDLAQMKANVRESKEQVVDVRHPVRYAGGPESRPGMRSGHIPGSFSFPYFVMFEADGRFKAFDKIHKQLMGIGLNMDAPIVAMCGSGITAAILDVVLDVLAQSSHALYDGSWAEWGRDTLFVGEAQLSERPVRTSLE